MATITTEQAAPPPGGLPKLLHLQILRTLAASLVVLGHSIELLDKRGIPSAQYLDAAGLCGHMGVSAFFALSGLIMVRQSASRFGVPGSALRFLRQRVFRIVPMYWLATLAWVAALWHWHNHLAHAGAQLAQSLLFLPDTYNRAGYMNPVLAQGWTLNYEMGFYLLFSLCLLLPRRVGIVSLIGALVLFAAAGKAGVFHDGNALGTLLNYYSNGIILQFAFGVLVGAVEIAVKRPARVATRISPALLLLLPPLLMLASPVRFHAIARWGLLGWYGSVVVVLCTLCRLERPGWFNAALVLLGDASYSTYLFQVWVAGLVSPLLAGSWLFARGAGFVAGCVVGANLLGLAIHLAVERPLTRALRTAESRTLDHGFGR